jgi:hypothetical protein
MRILLKYPIRARRQQFFSTLRLYLDMRSKKHDLVILVNADADDIAMGVASACMEFNTMLAGQQGVSGHYTIAQHHGKVAACNAGMDVLTADNRNWQILLLVSDDMIPMVHGYDDVIAQDMQQLYPDLDGVLWYNDGHAGAKLDTLCILGRKYYERFGYVYHPSYRSLWCDNEFMQVAQRLGRITYNPRVIIEHRHPIWTGAPRDALLKHNESFNGQDKALYESRRAAGFPR